MLNLLIPVDFSATSRNAALYAAGLARQIGSEKLVLYNAYQTLLSNFHANPDLEGLNEEDLQPLHEDQLYKVKQEMLSNINPDLHIESLCVHEVFSDDLTGVCRQTNTHWIVMGITGGGKLKERLVGSHTLKVSRNTDNLVMIVPPDARFTGIKKIMLLTDYEQVDAFTPFDVIHQLMIGTKAQLEVVHIEDSVAAKEQHGKIIATGSEKMHEHLLKYMPHYYTVYNTSFEQAVDDVVRQHSIDLIVVIPKKISFIDRMLHASHTDLLAFHSHVPVLVAHK
ncbi:MAG: hypothetical protein FGM61_06035 [Sediminibacterium sp.]|nr:hypothetical protein [Sediminibacterium sp.]